MPVRFIPDPPEDAHEKDGVRNTDVKISISKSVSKSIKVFVDGNAEQAIELIKMHESVVSDKKLKISYAANRALINSKKTQIAELKEDDPEKNSEEIDELADARLELKAANKQLQEYAYDYLEKMVGATLIQKWKQITDE